MRHIFLDTDVCIDLLSGRKPFVQAAEQLFSLADLGKIKVFVSALSFANIDYILRSQFSSRYSRQPDRFIARRDLGHVERSCRIYR